MQKTILGDHHVFTIQYVMALVARFNCLLKYLEISAHESSTAWGWPAHVSSIHVRYCVGWDTDNNRRILQVKTTLLSDFMFIPGNRLHSLQKHSLCDLVVHLLIYMLIRKCRDYVYGKCHYKVLSIKYVHGKCQHKLLSSKKLFESKSVWRKKK